MEAPDAPTVFGYAAPVRDENPTNLVLLLPGFALPAAGPGWRRSLPPVAVGAALALGPTALAWSTAPRQPRRALGAHVVGAASV